MTELETLIDEANRLLITVPGAHQVIVVRSAKGKVYHFANTQIGTHKDEGRFLSTLRELNDTAMESVVCMWQDGGLDVPSMHFRRGLLELNPANAMAELPLQSLNCLTVKRLETLV